MRTDLADAELARSILACSSRRRLVLAGSSRPEPEVGSMYDALGTPQFPVGSTGTLWRAAEVGSPALLSAESGLATPGPGEDGASLRLVGTLRPIRARTCDCCDEVRDLVCLEVARVVVVVDGRSLPVPVADYLAPELELNRGHLQRVAEHLNECHAEALRTGVTGLLAIPPGTVAGVQVRSLRAAGADLDWLDFDGGHRFTVGFAREAVTTAELGELLRDTLHPDLC